MDIRGAVSRVNEPSDVAHGVVATGLLAGLTLIEPRRLGTGGRLAYRGAVAATAAWMTWAGLRPGEHGDLMGPVARAAVTGCAAGTVLGLAEAGEALDARLHDRLVRAGARRPRLWLAAGTAALSAVAWWTGRRADVGEAGAEGMEEQEALLVEVPAALRAAVSRVLSATEDYSAPRLREHLEASTLFTYDEEVIGVAHAQFNVPDGLPKVVPGSVRFPAIGRFRALGGRTFDIQLFVEDGYLNSVQILEGAEWTEQDWAEWDEAGHDLSELEVWPSPDEIDLFIETGDGYAPCGRSSVTSA